MKKSTLLLFTMVGILSAMVISCKKTPAPTVEIAATIDGNSVAFTSTVTDVDTYSWDFGDGQTSTDPSPTHVYDVSGTYNASLTVKGEGGEASATKEIIIAPSVSEMLTGGPSATNGKTWVLTTAYYTGDGEGSIAPAMTVTLPWAENMLAMYSLEAEYDNEFTFFSNGNYTMNPVNGNVLAGAVYGITSGTIQGEPAFDIGMCAASFSAPKGATWTLNSTDLVVDAITDPFTSDIPPSHAVVSFTGKKWISLSDGAYFGILDFPTTAKFIITEITSDKLSVALLLCTYNYGDNMDDIMLPTTLVQLTFIPKPAK